MFAKCTHLGLDSGNNGDGIDEGFCSSFCSFLANKNYLRNLGLKMPVNVYELVFK